MKKLLLIDGNSILNRAYFAMMGRNMLSTRDGIYTNAIFGFLSTYDKFISDESPTHVAVAFDMKYPTFRHEMYEDYKAGRSPMPRRTRGRARRDASLPRERVRAAMRSASPCV